MSKITWSAENNSSYLNGRREAISVLAAARAARAYIRSELCGEGVATIYVDGYPVKKTERSIYTGYVWTTTDV